MGRPRRVKQGSGAAPPGRGIREDIRALNSSILLITQKMKYLVRNEKILGRNLIVLNKKIKSLEEKQVLAKSPVDGEGASSVAVQKLAGRLEAMENDNADLRARLASKEDLKEVKFIIDSINPLEFATLSQVRELIDKRVDELKKRDIENSTQNNVTSSSVSAPVSALVQPVAESKPAPTPPENKVNKNQNTDGSIK